MRNPTSCPDTHLLQQFMLGQVPDPEAQPLERHVAECTRCNALIDQLEMDDGLVAAMRARSPILSSREAPHLDRLIEQMRALHAPAVATPPTVGGHVPTPAKSATPTTHTPEQAYDFLDPPQGADELGRIGCYRVLKVLGSGGMGVVFQAEDARLRRLVALKLILDARYADPRYLARFEREAEALARLQHPNIVQIHEFGKHRGRPYLALEYVEGGNLADRLDGQPQPARDSAARLETLARAVHYAHQQGIVHRDLKPANVLLQRAESEGRRAESQNDPDGKSVLALSSQLSALRPKITDFGLAKRLDAVGLTQSGELLGTPGYMAPELTRGQGADSGPLVDVYALGAILYELLIGRPPFRGETVADTLEQVRSLEPVPPRRLRPGIPRDLETICLKCLTKEPARRYATAAALADDLDRFLRNEPVHARPVSPRERLAKWARRKPAVAVLLAISTVFAITLVVGVLIYNAQLRTVAIEARRQQERAESQYRQARDTLRQMLSRADARGGEGIPKLQELRREQQEDALAFFLKMAEQHGDDPDVRFDVAQARHQAGLLQSTLGRLDEATENLRQAEQQFAVLATEFPNRPQYRLHHADTLKVLGGVGRVPPAEAEECLRRALARTVELVRGDPLSVLFRSAEADVRITLGGVLRNQDNQANWTEVEAHYRRAAELYEELSREQPEVSNHRLVLARAYLNLSLILQTTKRPPHEFHDRAEASLEQLYREVPDDDEVVTSLAQLRVNWAYVLAGEGKPDAAIADLTKTVAMLEEALGREPNHAILRDRLFRSHGARSNILDSHGRFAESAEDWRRTVELSPSPQLADYYRLLLAQALARAGEHSLAVAEIEDWNTRTTPDTPADQLLHCAGVYSIALKTVQADSPLSIQREARDELVTRYVAQAVDFLRRVKQAHGADRWKLDAAEIRKDEQFKPLWDHAEFQRLLSEN